MIGKWIYKIMNKVGWYVLILGRKIEGVGHRVWVFAGKIKNRWKTGIRGVAK